MPTGVLLNSPDPRVQAPILGTSSAKVIEWFFDQSSILPDSASPSSYSKFVKLVFDDPILQTKKYADIIIPRGGNNHVAIDLTCSILLLTL
ncbi:hypothetical protein K1719_042062 [Acacia pycnantha]|nr:hypothetical protein K1719_042062 [Acacia pycnantha]